MPNSIDTYSDELLCDAILRKNFNNVGNEFIDDHVTAIRNFAFNACGSVTKVSCPNATVIGRQAFSGCKATVVELPWSLITSIGYRGFYGSGSSSPNPCRQTELILSELLTLGEYAFANAGAYTSQLQRVIAPKLEDIPGGTFRHQTSLENADFASGKPTGSSAFEGCLALKRVRFGGDVTTVPAKLFYGCAQMDTLILDNVTAVPTISNTNAFTNTKIASGEGYIYVPRAMISQFQNANRWSGFNYRAIEDYPSA